VPIVVGFTVKKAYLVRPWTDLQVRGHIWPDNGRIYRLKDISGPKVAGFIV